MREGCRGGEGIARVRGDARRKHAKKVRDTPRQWIVDCGNQGNGRARKRVGMFVDVQTPQNLMSKTTSSGPMAWRSTARGANESRLSFAACWRGEKGQRRRQPRIAKENRKKTGDIKLTYVILFPTG